MRKGAIKMSKRNKPVTMWPNILLDDDIAPPRLEAARWRSTKHFRKIIHLIRYIKAKPTDPLAIDIVT